MNVEGLNSAFVKSIEFADIIFSLFIPLCGCKNQLPIPKLEASHMA